MAEESNPNSGESAVWKLYKSVVDEVTTNSRGAFLDEGVDENVLQNLKDIWLKKIKESKALDCPAQPPKAHPTTIATKSPREIPNIVDASDQLPSFSGRSLVQRRLQNKQIQQASLNITVRGQNGPSSPSSSEPNKIVFVNITLPPQPGIANSKSRIVTIYTPASAVQGDRLAKILTSRLIASVLPLSTPLATSVLQQHVNAALQTTGLQKKIPIAGQLDGISDLDPSDDEKSSSNGSTNIETSEDGKSEESDGNKSVEVESVTGEDSAIEEDPLNTEDDLTSEDENNDAFEADNVVVCQYEKVSRSKNVWKFNLKHGVMNLSGKDYVFERCNGTGEW